MEQALSVADVEQSVIVQPTGRSTQEWRVSDRLSEAELDEMVRRFRSGTPKWKLAEEYGISESSVKRVVKKWKKS